MPVEVHDYELKEFHAQCEIANLDEIEISTFTGSGQTIVRPQSLIRPSHADVYVVALKGTKGFDHNGHNASDTDGGIVLFDVTQPYAISHATDESVMCVVIPRKLLDQSLGMTRAAVGLTLPRHDAISRVIQDFFAGILQHADDLSPSATNRLTKIGVDLIAAGFAEKLSAGVPERPSQIATMVRVRAFIERHLGDTELDATWIAAHAGLSLRRLFEIFANERLSLMDYVWERRLLRSRQLLSDQARLGQTIDSIANEVGFRNAAHFSRRFKARFEISPREFRVECVVNRATPDGR